jgi:putative Mg2+ transporter-C (MgtC) family protein
MTSIEMGARIAMALVLGAVIGFERQWHRRLAGLRTNALVAVGSAGFVLISALMHGENSPTRIAA